MNLFEFTALIKEAGHKDVFKCCVSYFKMCQGHQFRHFNLNLTNYTEKVQYTVYALTLAFTVCEWGLYFCGSATTNTSSAHKVRGFPDIEIDFGLCVVPTVQCMVWTGGTFIQMKRVVRILLENWLISGAICCQSADFYQQLQTRYLQEMCRNNTIVLKMLINSAASRSKYNAWHCLRRKSQ